MSSYEDRCILAMYLCSDLDTAQVAEAHEVPEWHVVKLVDREHKRNAAFNGASDNGQ